MCVCTYIYVCKREGQTDNQRGFMLVYVREKTWARESMREHGCVCERVIKRERGGSIEIMCLYARMLSYILLEALALKTHKTLFILR